MKQKALRVGDYLGHLRAAIQRIRRYTAYKSYADFIRAMSNFRMPSCEISRSSARLRGILTGTGRISLRCIHKSPGPPFTPCVIVWRMVIGRSTWRLSGRSYSVIYLFWKSN